MFLPGVRLTKLPDTFPHTVIKMSPQVIEKILILGGDEGGYHFSRIG